MSEANLYTGEADFEHGGVRMTSVAKRAGAEVLGATVYELAPGARWGELHYHYANEELLVVVDGRPTLHTLEGSGELEPGDVVAFRRGRRGAHRLENPGHAPVRVLMVSTLLMPDVVEYPERGRAFVMTEPPWTDAPYDETRGRIIRSFEIASGTPVPPDS